MNKTMNLLVARQYGLGTDSTQPLPNLVGLHPNSNTSVSSLFLHKEVPEGPRLSIEWWHRLDHLGPTTLPNTLERGYHYHRLGLGPDSALDGDKTARYGWWGAKLFSPQDSPPSSGQSDIASSATKASRL